MTLALRQANPERDRQLITAVLQRNLPGLPHDRRFEWLYLGNPAGEAWSWLLYEETTEEPIGVASVFPRTVWVGGALERCGQVGDFAIDSNYRSLGPAVRLQRATFEPVDEGHLAFCYDCPPHDQGMAPFRRLGINPYCRIARFARLQRSRRELEKRLRAGALSKALAHLVDCYLVRRSLRRQRSSKIQTIFHQGKFSEEFTELDKRAEHDTGIRACRSAAELNWRYAEDPLNSYRVVAARRGGELMGYSVFVNRGEDVFVVDLLALDLDLVGPALLDAISEISKSELVQALYAFAPQDSGVARFLTGTLGFRLRHNAASVVTYARSGTAAERLLNTSGTWFFSYADLLA